MALLACLWELAPRLRLHLEVATVDHGLRREAAIELALVARRAQELGLTWHALRVDVAATRASEGRSGAPRGGIQEVARRLRLAALSELAERRGLGQVALGHTADDQSETVLFRILRGTGTRGLAGIPYRRGPFVRPLLDVPRTEILSYLHRRSLPFAIDPSNSDLRYARARIRHRILPLLREENPRIDRALRSLAATAAVEFQTGGQVAEDDRDASLQLSRTNPDPDGGVDVLHIPTAQALEIADAAREGRGTQLFDIPGRRRVTVTYGRVSLDRPVSDVPAITPFQVAAPGTYQFGVDVQISVREDDGQGARVQDPRWSWFDRDLLAWPLSVRSRRAGDRMTPRGGKGSRKLSDLLIDAKIPRLDRDSLPVVTGAAGEVLFVPGLRPSQRGCPSSATVRRIGLAVLPKPDHDALVDRSITRGNTGWYPHQNWLPGERVKGNGESRQTGDPGEPGEQASDKSDGRS